MNSDNTHMALNPRYIEAQGRLQCRCCALSERKSSDWIGMNWIARQKTETWSYTNICQTENWETNRQRQLTEFGEHAT